MAARMGLKKMAIYVSKYNDSDRAKPCLARATGFLLQRRVRVLQDIRPSICFRVAKGSAAVARLQQYILYIIHRRQESVQLTSLGFDDCCCRIYTIRVSRVWLYIKIDRTKLNKKREEMYKIVFKKKFLRINAIFVGTRGHDFPPDFRPTPT